MQRQFRQLLILAATLATGACARAHAGSSAGPSPAVASDSAAAGDAAPRRSNPNLITADEIERSGASDAFSAIQVLRPRFLLRRGQVTGDPRPPSPKVYLDGQYYGEVSSLRSISVSVIETIRYLSSREATMAHGMDHEGGSIEITTHH